MLPALLWTLEDPNIQILAYNFQSEPNFLFSLILTVACLIKKFYYLLFILKVINAYNKTQLQGM